MMSPGRQFEQPRQRNLEMTLPGKSSMIEDQMFESQLTNRTINSGGKKNKLGKLKSKMTKILGNKKSQGPVTSRQMDREQEQDLKEVIQILQQQIVLKSKEIQVLKDSQSEQGQKERDRLILEHTATKMELATAQAEVEDK